MKKTSVLYLVVLISCYSGVESTRRTWCSRRSIGHHRWHPLAFAGAGGFGKATSSGKRTKKGRGKKKSVVVEPPTAKKNVRSTSVPSQEEETAPLLDKWGLPVPTLEDIFPPMPPGTELIGVDKQEYSLQEIKDAVRDVLPLSLDRFDASGVETNVEAGREPMKLRLLHQSPPVLAVDNFFTAQECQDVQKVALMEEEEKDAPVQIDSKTFSQHSLSTRTSTSWFCHFYQVPTLLAKAGHMLGIPVEQMEEPQIVRYKSGQEFSYHYDEVPPAQLDNGGQRLATLLVYLNTVSKGGGTIFRDLLDSDGQRLTVRPVQGSALLFFPAHGDGRPDDRTLHKGEVVGDNDEKWILQVWTHQRAYRPVVPDGNSQAAADEVVKAECQRLGYTTSKSS